MPYNARSSIPRFVVRSRQDSAINASPSTTNQPRRRHLGRGLVLAAATTLAFVGCSADKKSLSGSNSLAPLITGTLPPTTTSTSVPVATSTTIVRATPIPTTLVPETTVFNTTLITMSPPRIVPPSTAAGTVPAGTAAPDTPPAGPPDTASTDTAAPATGPTDTAAATTAAPSSCNSCNPDYQFPYASFFSVPQLGSEPVRGNGCGANGAIGNTIPDGVWDGNISVGGSSLQIDLECVYYGASAAPYIAQCAADNGGDCPDANPDFWIVNNNTRKRSVPLDPSFRRRYATADGCTDPGPGQGGPLEGSDAMSSWVVIEGGHATFALTSCVYG